MLANDMRKGTIVRLWQGWRATIVDNRKGLVRMADVEGNAREIGGIHVTDIAYVETDSGPEPLELTPAQARNAKWIWPKPKIPLTVRGCPVR